MSAATWRAWLDRVAASPLNQRSTLASWTRAVEALERCEDAAARQLIERLLSQGAALWQVAEDMCDAATPSASDGERRPVGSSVVCAQLFAAAASERTCDPTAGAGATTRLAASLSGIALGALATQAGSGRPCPATGASTDGIDRQLRRLSAAIEAGYDAHADSAAFANEVAAVFNGWLDAQDAQRADEA